MLSFPWLVWLCRCLLALGVLLAAVNVQAAGGSDGCPCDQVAELSVQQVDSPAIDSHVGAADPCGSDCSDCHCCSIPVVAAPPASFRQALLVGGSPLVETPPLSRPAQGARLKVFRPPRISLG